MRFAATKAARLAHASEAAQRKREGAKLAKLAQTKVEIAKTRAWTETEERRQDEVNADLTLRDYAPSDAELVEQIRADELARKRLRAKEAGVPVLESQIAAERRKTAVKAQAFKAAVLPLLHEMTDHPLDQARQILAQLEHGFTILLAADLVRDRFLGRQFVLPEGTTAPVAGGVIVRRFLDDLPRHLRSENLTIHALMPEANRIATAVIAEIEGA